MAKKTIITNVTLHLPAADFRAFKYDGNGLITQGRYAVDAVPPGTPVTLEADEARAILARFGGEILESAEDAAIGPAT